MAQEKKVKGAESEPFGDDGALGLTRSARLEIINAELAGCSLPLRKQTGKHNKGEYELLRIRNIHLNRYYAVVEYAVICPDGQLGTYYVQVNRRFVTHRNGKEGKEVNITGAVCLMTIDDEWLVLIRQHRPTVSEWTTEIPRGFVPAGIPFGRFPRIRQMPTSIAADLTALAMQDIPFGILGSELAPLISTRFKGDLLTLTRLAYLGTVLENTGISENRTAVMRLSASSRDPDVVRALKSIRTPASRPFLVPLKGIDEAWASYGLESAYCLATILMLLRDLRQE